MAVTHNDLLDIFALTYETAPPWFKARMWEMQAIIDAEREEDQMTQMQSSGEERTFSSGAVRDGGKKPMLQLISPYAYMRLGEWLRFACQDRQPKPYPPRNWEKGMPFSETIGAIERHVQKIKMGLRDEDHAAAILFGGMALAHYEHEIAAGRMDPALDDMPHYEDQPVRYEHIRRESDPKPGDRRINPQTGQEEVFALMGPDGAVVFDADDEPETYAHVGPNGITATEIHVFQQLQKRVDRGELLGDLENTEFQRLLNLVDDEPTFYICGPMRGLPFFNFPAFDGARDYGKSLGYNIISPADLDRECGIDPIKDPASPQRAEASPNTLHNIVARDVDVLLNRLKKTRGDGLALLPGWEHSVGGMAEVRLAYWLGLKFVDACDWEPVDIAACLGDFR